MSHQQEAERDCAREDDQRLYTSLPSPTFSSLCLHMSFLSFLRVYKAIQRANLPFHIDSRSILVQIKFEHFVNVDTASEHFRALQDMSVEDEKEYSANQ